MKTKKEDQLRLKRWLAVLLSNAGIKLQYGELDQAISDHPEFTHLMFMSPNDENLIRYVKRGVCR